MTSRRREAAPQRGVNAVGRSATVRGGAAGKGGGRVRARVCVRFAQSVQFSVKDERSGARVLMQSQPMASKSSFKVV